jgi:hypothetical protein
MYADVCWQIKRSRDQTTSRATSSAHEQLLAYADVCWRMLTYADVCWQIKKSRDQASSRAASRVVRTNESRGRFGGKLKKKKPKIVFGRPEGL